MSIIFNKISGISRFQSIMIGIALTILVAFCDFTTGVEISFSVFYLIPISFVTWNVSRNWGFVFSVIGALLWRQIDLFSGSTYSMDSIIWWNAIVRFGFFAIVTILLSYIKVFNAELEKKVKVRTHELESEIEERKAAEEKIIKINEQLSKMAITLENIKEEENLRIARELHDEFGQILTGMKIDLSWLVNKYNFDSDLVSRVNNLLFLVNETIKSVRKITTQLRPRLLDELGLIPAIEIQLKEFKEKTGIEYTLQVPSEKLFMEKSKELNIFRIMQEALTNVVKHSSASKVDVALSLKNSELLLNISDNGNGIKKEPADESSFGIIGMKERVKILNGSISLNGSTNGKTGTSISLIIPHKQY